MRIFRFVILGLVGIGFIRGSSNVDTLADGLDDDCRERLHQVRHHCETEVGKLSGWTLAGDVSIEERNRGLALVTLSKFSVTAREFFESVCPAATNDGRERRAFDSEIENAYEELNKAWDKRIITTKLISKRDALCDAMRRYTPTSVAQELLEEYKALEGEYPEDFLIWFVKLSPGMENYEELKRRAGLVDSDKEQMDKTLNFALNGWSENYLESIRKCGNIERLEDLKTKKDNELKALICPKYIEDVATIRESVDEEECNSIYQVFFDTQIKAAYEEKISQLTAASRAASRLAAAASAAVVTPHHNFK